MYLFSEMTAPSAYVWKVYSCGRTRPGRRDAKGRHNGVLQTAAAIWRARCSASHVMCAAEENTKSSCSSCPDKCSLHPNKAKRRATQGRLSSSLIVAQAPWVARLLPQSGRRLRSGNERLARYRLRLFRAGLVRECIWERTDSLLFSLRLRKSGTEHIKRIVLSDSWAQPADTSETMALYTHQRVALRFPLLKFECRRVEVDSLPPVLHAVCFLPRHAGIITYHFRNSF